MRDLVDNHPSAGAKHEGEGVAIDHKSHGYCAVLNILLLVRLAALHEFVCLIKNCRTREILIFLVNITVKPCLLPRTQD